MSCQPSVLVRFRLWDNASGESYVPWLLWDAAHASLGVQRGAVGDFKNGGREWQPKATPEKVLVHDF
ncbi:MAG: hypothetical protein JW940_04355, partial [Polyangiaceae bacterium]|nr:hypothetical protein [Polyangiaceae bacterium]